MKHPYYKCLNCKNTFKSYNKSLKPKYCTRKCYQQRVKNPETLLKMSLAKIGKSPWNKGVKMWEGKEHPGGTLGMVGLNKGVKRTEETRLKLRISHIGLKCPYNSNENHWNWQGGVTRKNEKIRKSTDYKQWRVKVFERDKYACVVCFKKGGYLNADHIIPFCKDESKRLDIENGRTLCLSCHMKTDTFGGRVLKKPKGKNGKKT